MKPGRVFLFLTVLFLLPAHSGLATGASAMSDPLGGTGGGPISGSISVRVVLDGTTDPVAGAFVMIGSWPGDPFDGNWGLTSAAGEISFADPALQGPVTVTAGAAGLRYFTLVSVDANDLVIPLKPVSMSEPVYEVGDFVSGIDVDNGWLNSGDGFLDMAFVIPAFEMNPLMAFNMANLLGPSDTVDILGQPFEVPSNVFIPQQYESFVEVNKEYYSLYLGAGDYTLSALSGRVSVEAFLAAGDIVGLIPQIGWRETDILDVTVAGDNYGADLFVDPDLTGSVNLTLGNLPENSTAWCISVGDLDSLNGRGRLTPLGLNSFDCPGGGGSCGGNVNLTTTAATGEFAGMDYFPAVAVELETSDDVLVVMNRQSHPQAYSETVDDFFQLLDLTYSDGVFDWNDVENPASGSPAVDLHSIRLQNAAGDSIPWEFLLPGNELTLSAPYLPNEAPAGPAHGMNYSWQHAALGLAYDLPSFDFDSFAFSDMIDHSSHLAFDNLPIVFSSPVTGSASAGAPPRFALAENRPNPFNPVTTIAFTLEGESKVALGIYDAGGRKVTTLIDGRRNGGSHQVRWEGIDRYGRAVPSGIYFARLQAGDFTATKKMVLIR